MKNILLPTLFWVLAFNAAYAQRALPPALQPYASNLSYSVSKSMHEAGFLLPAMPDARNLAGAEMLNPEFRLDSTENFYGYELNGIGDSLPFARSIYKYPFSDVKIEINYMYEAGEWKKINRTTFVSDAQHRLVEALAEVFDETTQAFLPDSYLEVLPHGNSATLMDAFIVSQWDDTIMDWKVLFSTKNTFDDSDRLLESLSTFDYFGEPLLLKDVYGYDANGDNVLIESFSLFGGIEYPSGNQQLEYENHLLTVLIEFAPDDQGEQQPVQKTEYTYTGAGKTETENHFGWDVEKEDWRQNEALLFAYDNVLRLSARETRRFNLDMPEERERIAYAYLADENLALESFFTWNGSVFLLSERKFYHYSEQLSASPEPFAEAAPLLASPNPTAGVISVNLSVPASLRIYDSQGALLRSVGYEPEDLTDLGDLPGGLYFISAVSGQKLYSGRFVKK